MNALKCWLLTVAMLLSLSATAGVHSTVMLTDNVYSSQIAHNVTDDIANQVVRRGEKKKTTAFIENAPRSTTHRSVLFLANAQAEPIYELHFEFSPANVSSGRFDVSALDNTPWFLQSSTGSTRVSGWKDGNSLYAASVTYHS